MLEVYLHGVVGVFVIKHQRLLDELVVSLQLVDVGFISDDDVLKLLQLGHLVLQGSHLQGTAANLLPRQHMVTSTVLDTSINVTSGEDQVLHFHIHIRFMFNGIQ